MAKRAVSHRPGARLAVLILATAVLAVPGLVSSAVAQTNEARPAKGSSTEAAAGGDAALKSRVDALEEQLVDMQVVVGTLESLTKSGGAGGAAAAPFPSAGGADAARIDSLETQVRALTAQMQQLTDQLRSSGFPHNTDTASSLNAPSPGSMSAQPAPGFGSTTVSSASNGNDAIGGYLDGPGRQDHPAEAGAPPAAAPAAPPAAAPVATAALPPGSETSGDPKQAYETAYGYLLQRDYGSAETAFSDFLKKFPNDSLSGNAQYWLGETYFVRGQYKAAAGAFLKGYQTYAQSGKAADSLLKLAMSLDRLGQKDAACSSFAELATKFPTAPQNVRARAQSERQRVGCQ